MNSNNQVKQLRLQRAWSQEQLAEMAGLSVRTIQRIENGERPGLETLSALAAVFEVTVAEIGGEARREDAPGQEASLDLRIEEAKARVHQESRFFRSLSVALVVCVLLAVLNRFTNPQYYWSGWVALIWGALLVVRGLRLFVFGEWIKNRRQARLQRLLRK
ncbi:TPA: helix-turn-helix domain-containing protein [Klebsiella pneumoniae]|nr:helix-turn-helix domain-containing protein [Klebsiella pneumoniae]